MAEIAPAILSRTPLYDLHVSAGARIVPFAGYEMPVQYPGGIIAEHNWTRKNAGLFDVSHMGQCFVSGPDFASVAAAVEKLVPADVAGLALNQQRYSQLLNEAGGILDDVMVTRIGGDKPGDQLYVVVNASRKAEDFAHISANLPAGIKIRRADELALVALQGPQAESVLVPLAPEIAGLEFMQGRSFSISGIAAHVSRSGYTGEDGFEISVPARDATRLWQVLVQNPAVKPVGLGARDSLRLEAGLCLYGHDIDETTSPVEAGLVWSIGKRRRTEGGFIGEARVRKELAAGPSRKRVGIRPEGRAPARDGTVIQSVDGQTIGTVTSGGFGPSVDAPVAMGYVGKDFAVPGTAITLIVRGKPLPASVVTLPFVSHNFKR